MALAPALSNVHNCEHQVINRQNKDMSVEGQAPYASCLVIDGYLLKVRHVFETILVCLLQGIHFFDLVEVMLGAFSHEHTAREWCLVE